MEKFGSRLVSIRKQRHLTQEALAAILKVSRSHVANMERGTREPSDIIITMICNELSINEEWLRTGEGEPFFDSSAALQRAYATYFMEISRAFSPVFSAYGEMLTLFQHADVMRMFNYLAYKIKRGGYGAKNIHALMQTFDAAFPGYAAVIADLERQNALVRQGMDANIAAQDYLMPVSGQAAAGLPLYSELADRDSVPVPQKYCNDRYLVIQAKGNSMEPRIKDGSYVVAQRHTCPEQGSLAVVYIDGLVSDEYVIKLFYDRGDTAELRSYNPDYRPMIYPMSQIIRAERIVHLINGDG